MFTTNNCYLQLYYVDLSSLQLKILLIKIHKKNHWTNKKSITTVKNRTFMHIVKTLYD